jgi:asparagine synthase (glutamine-hydrolysing)
MCGVAGFFSPSGFDPASASETAERMRDRLVHRGPDDAGLWLDGAAGIALAHRRLSILDLSPNGHQPMMSPSGRYCLAFNGEVYNHHLLRQLAEAHGHSGWRGNSDTESLLGAIEAVGLIETLKASVGMFALALWDRETRTLHLARDRMGEKPLHYGWHGGVLLFGSELKALRAHPAFVDEIDPSALHGYLQTGYIAAPRTVWRGISKLLPGTTVSFGPRDAGLLPAPMPYWSLMEVAIRGQEEPFEGSDDEAVGALEHALGQAVEGQIVADVPLGAFLSGGIDSSTVVALMQARSSRRVRTFSIGFREAGYDEAQHARAVAQHLGTDHTEMYVTSDDARGVVPSLPDMFDEPFGDSSAIPTYLVAKLARQHVTVALSGDGGDELFAGYQRYYNHALLTRWRRAQRVPRAAWAAVGLANSLCGLLPGRFVARVSTRLEWHRRLRRCRTETDVYRFWERAPVLSQDFAPARSPRPWLDTLADPLHRSMALDSMSYLPDDILAKVDRTAMAVSLETRVPLLDRDVIELAWRMPARLKHRDGESKWLLRQLAYRHIPRALLDRPKMGFGVPVDSWLRGPLREWAEDLLSESSLRAVGHLDVRPVRNRWHQHLSGHRNWRDSIWTLLMWQAWRRHTPYGGDRHQDRTSRHSGVHG